MSQKNSQNMGFLVLLALIVVLTFAYAFTFYYSGGTIYTDIKEIPQEN